MYATVREMARALVGGKIRRIVQLGPDQLLFTVFRGAARTVTDGEATDTGVDASAPDDGPEMRFLVSVEPRSPRLHLARDPYGSAETPSAFCMQLRKHLEGARITAVQTAGLERVTVFDLTRGGRPGTADQPTRTRLVVQLLPTSRTVLLLDHVPVVPVVPLRDAGEPCLSAAERATSLSGELGLVLGDMRHHARKGTPFRVEPSPLPHAIDLRGDDVVCALSVLPEPVALERALTHVAFGLAMLHAREIATRAGLDPRRPLPVPGPGEKTDGAAPHGPSLALALAWDAFWRRLREGLLSPQLVRRPDGGLLVLPFPFRSIASSAGHPPSVDAAPNPVEEATPDPAHPAHRADMSRLLERAHAEASGQAGLADLRHLLASTLDRQHARVRRRLEAQQNDLETTTHADVWRHRGDLLTASLHAISPRAKSVRVVDYSQEDAPEIDIALDADLSAGENAQACYARYKRLKRGREAIGAAVERTLREIEWLDGMLAAVETAVERDDLREIEHEMHEARLLAGPPPRRSSRGAASSPRRYEIDGHDVRVGRNPRQNDALTLHTARPDDFWLHARQIPGAHVIVRSTGAAPPPEHVLRAAAQLAATFSRAANDTRVAVDCTRVRYVKKPPNTPAGYVTYTHERTIIVSPSESGDAS